MNKTLDLQLEQLLQPPRQGDLDGGGEGPQISRKTIERTRECINQLKQILQEKRGIDMGDPLYIGRDLQGGVDVEWRKNREYGVLMNVTEKGEASYFWQRDDNSDELKGNL